MCVFTFSVLVNKCLIGVVWAVIFLVRASLFCFEDTAQLRGEDVFHVEFGWDVFNVNLLLFLLFLL